MVIISFRLWLSAVAPVILSWNRDRDWVMVCSISTMSSATGVLESRVRKDIAGARFLGDLLGLGVSGCSATLWASLGICDGVKGTPDFASEAGRGTASSRLNRPMAVLIEKSRIDRGYTDLLPQPEA